MSMFPKRAGKFMKGLLNGLNASTFTPITSITDPIVSAEQQANIDSTVKILGDMQYVEVQTDANGVHSLRLTPSGVEHTKLNFGGSN